MENNNYMPRIIDSELKNELRLFGGVLVVGPKWCGKTTSASKIAASALYMQDEDTLKDNLMLADLKPSNLLIGDKPRLIDEWQMAPKLWGAVRYDIDKQAKRGLYILTGSMNVDEDSLTHSGAGRISRLVMRTMSLFESGDSTGEIRLSELFTDNLDKVCNSSLDYGKLASVIVRGGWPTSIGLSDEDAMGQLSGYCNVILRSQIDLPGGKRRDEQKMGKILKSLARNTSTSAANTTILKDITAEDGDAMGIAVLSEYIKTLKALCIVEDLGAWSPKLRSKTAIRTSDVRHLSDPSLAAHFLGAGPRDLEMSPSTFGFLFESLVIRDLRIYSQPLGGTVYHYRDEEGLEVDAIIHLRNGNWGAVEVKLGSNYIDEGAKNLIRLKNKVDSDFTNSPSFLAVITGTNHSYLRDDGVYVIPLGCLRD